LNFLAWARAIGGSALQRWSQRPNLPRLWSAATTHDEWQLIASSASP
jgi:hypothetical protein